jgi:hypothetical protein
VSTEHADPALLAARIARHVPRLARYRITAVVGDQLPPARLRVVVEARDIGEALELGCTQLEQRLGHSPRSVWAQRETSKLCAYVRAQQEPVAGPNAPSPQVAPRFATGSQSFCAVAGCGRPLHARKRGGYDPATGLGYCERCALRASE